MIRILAGSHITLLLSSADFRVSLFLLDPDGIGNVHEEKNMKNTKKIPGDNRIRVITESRLGRTLTI